MKIKLEKPLAWEHDLPEPNTWRNNCTSHIHLYFPQQILYLPCCSLRSELLSEKGSIIYLLGCSFVKLITRTNFDPIELYLTILVLFIFLLILTFILLIFFPISVPIHWTFHEFIYSLKLKLKNLFRKLRIRAMTLWHFQRAV